MFSFLRESCSHNSWYQYLRHTHIHTNRHKEMVGYLFEWLLVTTTARQLRVRRQLFMVYHLYYR